MKKILLILLSGNLIAQGINALFIPISTRLYTPEDFDNLAVFISVLMIVSTVAGGRFDFAILKAKTQYDTNALLHIAVLISLLSSLISIMILIVFMSFSTSPIVIYYWLLPPLIVGVVAYNALYNIANINSDFSRLSKSRVIQALSSNLTLSFWGYFIGTGLGLFLGYGLLYSAGIFSLYKSQYLDSYSINELKAVIKKYIVYPKYSITESLSDVAGYQLPIALIGIYIQGAIAGYLFIAIKIMNLSISIIAKAFSNYYLVEVREKKELFKLDKAVVVCGLIGFSALTISGVFFDRFSGVLLGKSWENLGSIILLILPWFSIQFITTIFNPIFYIFSEEQFVSKLQLYGNFLRITAFVLALYFDPSNIITYLGIINFLFYSAWLYSIFYIFRRVSIG